MNILGVNREIEDMHASSVSSITIKTTSTE